MSGAQPPWWRDVSSPIIVEVHGDGDNDVGEGHSGSLFLRDGRTGNPIWTRSQRPDHPELTRRRSGGAQRVRLGSAP